MAVDARNNAISNTPGRSYVYLDVVYGTVSTPENVIIELFEDICPKTTQNFRELCKGFTRPDGKTIGYKGCYFNRIVQGQYI